jgi:hypothetical protein
MKNSHTFRNRLKYLCKRLKCKIFFLYLYMYEHMDKYEGTYEQNS